jgi:hypothetical protein
MPGDEISSPSYQGRTPCLSDALAPVRGVIGGVEAPYGEPPNGLRLPSAYFASDPGQIHEVGISPKYEVDQGPSCKICRRDAVSDVPTRPAEPGALVQPDSRAPIPRYAERGC